MPINKNARPLQSDNLGDAVQGQEIGISFRLKQANDTP